MAIAAWGNARNFKLRLFEIGWDEVILTHPVCGIALIAPGPLFICVRINTYIEGSRASRPLRNWPDPDEELVILLLVILCIL